MTKKGHSEIWLNKYNFSGKKVIHKFRAPNVQ